MVKVLMNAWVVETYMNRKILASNLTENNQVAGLVHFARN